MELVQRRCAQVKDYNSLPYESVLLADRYIDLLITVTQRQSESERKELLCATVDHYEKLTTRASEEQVRNPLDQLFEKDSKNEVPKAVILQGDSGYGKTFTVKIMLDWASGNKFKDLFDLVFHLECRKLNAILGENSLVDLLNRSSCFTSETEEVLKDKKMKLLFVIDGFDELKFSFQEESRVPPKDHQSFC